MPELLVVLVGLAVAGVVVLAPLVRAPTEPAADTDDDRDAAAVRHRVALEALRDVETDRLVGSLDDVTYAEQLIDAEQRAAQTRTALGGSSPERRGVPRGPSRRAAFAAAAFIGGAVMAAMLVPAAGVANGTVINESLADAQAAETARQARIAELSERLAEDPTDASTLSALADAHLAGSSREDLVRAAVALQLLIEVEPNRPDAFERIITAYLRAGDYANARAAHDAYIELDSADPAEAAFFEGLIALRGENDPERAAAAFDRFLELAPDDPRAGMVEGLRDEAAAGSP